MNAQRVIALDVDGPCANLHEEWYRRYNRDWDDNLTLDRVKTWDLHKFVKPECGKKIYEYLLAPDLYASVKPVTAAAEVVAILRAEGYKVVYVTMNHVGMTDQKAAWLVQHGFTLETTLGRLLPEDLIVTSAKLLIDADLIIDDRASTIRDWVELRRRKAILFDMPHNRHLMDDVPSTFWSWCGRHNDWGQILKYIRAELPV